MDADGPGASKNDVIGSYSFDAESVYFQKVRTITTVGGIVCMCLMGIT